MAVFDPDNYDVAEDLYVMVIGPEGRWGTVPAKVFIDQFSSNARDETWQEISRETEDVLIEAPQGPAELEYRRILNVTFELQSTSDEEFNEFLQNNPDQRRRMTLKMNPPDLEE